MQGFGGLIQASRCKPEKLSHVKVLQGVFFYCLQYHKNESVKVRDECASNEKLALGVITQPDLSGWRRTETQDV